MADDEIRLPPGPAMLDADRIVQDAGVHKNPQALRYMVRKEQFPQGLRIGRTVVWPRTVVEEWLRERAAAARGKR